MRVICKSGLWGWRQKLQSIYMDKNEWISCAEIYGLHTKLGYDDPQSAWDDNPLVEGSVQPSDYRKVAA